MEKCRSLEYQYKSKSMGYRFANLWHKEREEFHAKSIENTFNIIVTKNFLNLRKERSTWVKKHVEHQIGPKKKSPTSYYN